MSAPNEEQLAEGELRHRDDLGRYLAKLWRQHLHQGCSEFKTSEELRAALDRLAAAHLLDGPQDVPR